MTTTDFLASLQTALADRYPLEREIGRGGMATVYLAEDLKHRRKVAIKVLRPELAAALGPDRFLREIRFAATLHHPHILPLYDSGEAGGFLYYVMPFVEGESLRDRLVRETQLPLKVALQITREVADGLSYAHSRDVVHRDIKPENILLESGHALVSDFGIARAINAAGSDEVTQTGLIVGTPVYMSPEQASGERTLSGCSDVYSLGCVLYEMLAGEPPYTGPTAQAILARRLSDPVPPLRTVRETVPVAVERAIGKALAKVPADRFPTAAEFAEALVRTSAIAAPEQSIAVLPFANMSADPDTEYFSEGITEEIINVLSALGGMRVAARTSSFAFKGKTLDVAEIGAKLHVRTVLEGGVRRAGNRLRITAQLINVADGFQLWSERYDRQLDDVFAIQDEIARSIAERLKVTLSGPAQQTLVASATSNMEAYDLYLKGRYFWARRGPSLLKAVDYFNQAIAIDAGFAAPYAGLVDSYTALSLWGYVPSMEAFELAREAGKKALSLGDGLAEAHCAVGFMEIHLGWRHDVAEHQLRRASEIHPSWGLPFLWLGFLLTMHGRLEEALAAVRRGYQLEPLSPVMNGLASAYLCFMRAFDEAQEVVQRALELDSSFPISLWAAGMVHQHHGRNAEAIALHERMMERVDRSPLLLSLLANTYAYAGRSEQARQLLVELEACRAPAFLLGHVHWQLGDDNRALALFEQGVAERDPLIVTIPMTPTMERLRLDPRWKEMLERAGLGAVAHANG